ncbi:MAG: hypothetical protein IPP29_11465 [Bacteroidetes bacterium]|nr:hypothetical protein [Bacteroidota bacterium]
MEKAPNFSKLESEFLKYRFGQYLYHFNNVVKVHKKEFWYRIKSEYDKLGSSHKEVLKSSNMLLNLALNKSYLFYNHYETASKWEARINKTLFGHNIGKWLKSKIK